MASDEALTYEEQVRIARRLPHIARLIDRELVKAAGGKRVPWSLYTWGGNRCQYISNTSRDQAKIAMQDTLDRWNEPQDPPPGKRGWQ